MKHPKTQMQFRYYETSPDCHVLALLGSSWNREYGNDLETLHFHNHLEIGYCRDGGGTMDYGDRKLPYTKGSITVVPPNHIHHTNSHLGKKCHWEYLFVDVESILHNQFSERAYRQAQFIQQIYKEALVLQHAEHPQIANLILAIMEEHRGKAKHYIDSVKGMLQSLMICLVRLGDEAADDISTDKRVGAITAAIDYVAKHYRDKITISTLAEACHLSETHFRRLFSQAINMSPQTYINRIRIDAACKLLRTTNEAIGEIAVKCGFVTISSLNRNFKETMGMSPTQFRKDTQYYVRKLNDSRILPYEGWR
ncbi:MAG: AraC family transcriptional regulator [Oscillospiraceae bacterium]|nr:AraC family transcriptional regulator [Oscillospiraceae bacterium]